MSAIISDCKNYRYVLKREIIQPIRWVKPCLFIMLNPSKADASINDPTIKKCMKFAKREGCTKLTVINLFALRSTNADELLIHSDPEGMHNGGHQVTEIENNRFGPIICAWGSHKSIKKTNYDVDTLIQIIKNEGVQPLCFKINKDGNPMHPLYVPDNAKLIAYNGKEKK